MTVRPTLHLDLTIDQILRTWPETAAVFLTRRTGCVGCRLGHLCTLQDVLKAYSLPAEVLLQDLEECIRINLPLRNNP